MEVRAIRYIGRTPLDVDELQLSLPLTSTQVKRQT